MAQALNHWRGFALLLVAGALIRAQTFGNPVIGFDEQFYLVVGDRMLSGVWPYVDIFDRKPIGLFLIYAAIAALPGETTLWANAATLAFATTTAWVILHAAGGSARGLFAAIAYLAWLNLLEGEGGQAPVFYNLPVALAAWIVLRRVEAEKTDIGGGAVAAMLLVGVAIQIKTSVIFEGALFGLALLWAARDVGVPGLLLRATLWVAAALFPTALAYASYALAGHGEAWWFANVASLGGKLPDPWEVRVEGLATILGILSPLLLLAALARPRGFIAAWLGVALGGMIAFGAFGSPHYALPVLVPLCIAAAAAFERRHKLALGVLTLGLVAGQAVLAVTRLAKGGAPEAYTLAAAAQPRKGGCIYVYDGYPALYRLVDTCLPTRWVFPGHLNTANEASAAALGVAPVAEVGRILASEPETIVIDLPLFERGNPATWALVKAALDREYVLAREVVTGRDRRRQVWRRR